MGDLDILCFGEPLYELAETERDGERLFRPGFGGDVSNVAIADANGKATRVGFKIEDGKKSRFAKTTGDVI